MYFLTTENLMQLYFHELGSYFLYSVQKIQVRFGKNVLMSSLLESVKYWIMRNCLPVALQNERKDDTCLGKQC